MEKSFERKIKVLIIDDSAVIRQLLSEILAGDEEIEVVATAIDPIIAKTKLKLYPPDVITLDVEMPRMDGLQFLEELMRENPMPVLMISSLTQKNSETAIRALELGAVDCIPKPAIDITEGIATISSEIIDKVKMAAKARVRRLPVKSAESVQRVSKSGALPKTSDRIIAIGASTGGTQALAEIITALPATCHGIVVAQHMPPTFTRSFANRLNSISQVEVREAKHGDRVLKGTVLIAPGNEHLIVRRNGAMYIAELSSGPPVNYVRPSVDVLFASVAECAGKNATGVILTGMGEDGARGLKAMRTSGAYTIAQDEKTSIVFGMPKKAIEIGAAQVVAPLEAIAKLIIK